MKRACLAIIFASLLSLSAIMAPVAAETNDDSVGIRNYWDYRVTNVVFSNVTFDVDLHMEIVKKDSVRVLGPYKDVYMLDVIGRSETGTSANGTIIGLFSIDCEEFRMVDNYSLFKQDAYFKIEMHQEGDEELMMDEALNIVTEYKQTRDDYLGNNALNVGTQVISNTSIDIVQKRAAENAIDVVIIAEYDYDERLVMEVVETNVPVTTDAGTFDCVKIRAQYNSTSEDATNMTMYYYYSDLVKNYVKVEYNNGFFYGVTAEEMTLTSYGLKSLGVIALFFGDNIWVTMTILFALVMVSIFYLVKKSKKMGIVPMIMPTELRIEETPEEKKNE
ncbi:MAG TPA: hypothetical protein ENN25_03235 [Euryarchaeota archaeon]|nr:hypothetical protein [Euryarchaeota archaeon]